VKLSAGLRAWLASAHDTAPRPGITTRDDDPSTESLLVLTRALRPLRADIEGTVVLHHPSGQPFATACPGRVLLRSRSVTAALEPQPLPELPGWWAVDASPADVVFARGRNLLRDALALAFAEAAGPDE
jgi:hypothetical protein